MTRILIASLSAAAFLGCGRPRADDGAPDPKRAGSNVGAGTGETLATGGAASEPAPPIVVGAGEFDIEGGATLKALEGATGGKAILFETESAVATARVRLEAGTYDAALFLRGPDFVHDGLDVTVDGGAPFRMYNNDHGRFGPAKVKYGGRAFEIRVAEAREVVIVVRPGETGVYVDRLEIRRAAAP